MNLFRVYGDESGETHLVRIDLPLVENPPDGLGTRLGLLNVPATTLDINELLGPKEDRGFHTISRRQLVVVLRGVLEITTTAGDCERLQAGDCLIADDPDTTKGHRARDVGDERLASLVVGIGPEWECPVS